jgi:hypothetical protein
MKGDFMSDQLQPKQLLTTNKEGKFELDTIESQLVLADKLIRNRLISDTFKNPQQVVIAIQNCKSLGIDPMVGLKMMYVVHGKPAIFGDLPLSLIQSTGQLEEIEEFWVDDDGNKISVENKNLKAIPYAAICRIKRKGDPIVQEDYFTLDDMKLAQIKSPTWNRYQRTMMRYRARTQAIKSKFADILNGIEIAEYSSNDLPREGVRIDSPPFEPITKYQLEEILVLLGKIERNEDEVCSHATRKFNRPIEAIKDFSTTEADQIIAEISQFLPKDIGDEN